MNANFLVAAVYRHSMEMYFLVWNRKKSFSKVIINFEVNLPFRDFESKNDNLTYWPILSGEILKIVSYEHKNKELQTGTCLRWNILQQRRMFLQTFRLKSESPNVQFIPLFNDESFLVIDVNGVRLVSVQQTEENEEIILWKKEKENLKPKIVALSSEHVVVVWSPKVEKLFNSKKNPKMLKVYCLASGLLLHCFEIGKYVFDGIEDISEVQICNNLIACLGSANDSAFFEIVVVDLICGLKVFSSKDVTLRVRQPFVLLRNRLLLGNHETFHTFKLKL